MIGRRQFVAAAVMVATMGPGCAKGGDVVFLVFAAKGCAPCVRLHRDFAERRGFRFLDVAADRDEAAAFGVRSTPTVVAVDSGGREIDRHVGYVSQRSLARWADRIEATNE